MNRVFRLVWNASLGSWVAASELAKCGRPGSGAAVRRSRSPAAERHGARGFPAGASGRALVASAGALFAAGTLLAAPACADPQGAVVTAGTGSVTQSGAVTTVQQSTPTLSLDWSRFDVAAHETVNFVQPGATSIAVNRVLGGGASRIFGRVNANGQVWLLNPNGVLFGRGAQVRVGGLVASTLAAADPGALDGTHRFAGASTAAVVNEGSLIAVPGGAVALLGARVENLGTIDAPLGSVALAGGSGVTLSFGDSRLLRVTVDEATFGGLVANHGLVQADGGAVHLAAGAQDGLLASTVNSTGVVRAAAVEERGGTIVLVAGGADGVVSAGGTLDASAADGRGGSIELAGTHVTIAADARLDATGATGGGLIHAGGGWQGAGATARTVTVGAGAVLDASATRSGDGGEVIAYSKIEDAGSSTTVHGTLLATGGHEGGDGGRVETSGHLLDVDGAMASAAAPHGRAGEWLLDPQNVTIGGPGNTAIGGGGTITYVPTGTSTISASSIATALQNGSNVTITTGSTGGSLGDITVASAITRTGGSADVTLRLQAANSIIVNEPIAATGGTGKLNVQLYADNDNGSRDGAGVTILNSGITTRGGTVTFGSGATMTVNGVANTLVGGDVYVGGSSGVGIVTTGGNVTFNGQLIVANATGLSVNTTNDAGGAGDVTFQGTLDSGNSYAYVASASLIWNSALAAAKNGVGANVGDTYLATLTTRLENAVGGWTANYSPSWLGGARVTGIGTDATWRWVAGPEGLANAGVGTPFFTQNGSANSNGSGGTTLPGFYSNWNSGEPNNYNATGLSAANTREWVLQFVGTQGQWNDLPGNSGSLPYVRETNLAASTVSINAAGTGTVTFNDAIGRNKPINVLTVTADKIKLNDKSTTIVTSNGQNLGGQVQLNGADVNVLTVYAPNVTTVYGATLPTLTPTYSGFVGNDSVATMTSPAVAATTGTTATVSTAPITVSGAVDPDYLILYNPGVLIVNPAPLTVTGTTVATKVYDGTTAATLSGGTLVGVLAQDLAGVTLTQAGSFASRNAGVGVPVVAADAISGSAAANYTLVQPTLTGTITPRALTVTGTTVANKVYDGTATATLSGGSLQGVLPVDAGAVTLAQIGAFPSKNAGTALAVTAANTLGGSAAANYALTQPTGLTANITPRNVTLSGASGQTKTYDGTTALTAGLGYGTPTGFLAGDAVRVSGSAAYDSAAAGSRTIVRGGTTLTGADAANYSLVWTNGSGTITPAPLLVTANDDARFVGLADTVGFYGVSYGGLVAGDTAASLGGTLAITRSNAGTDAAGTYAGVLVPSGLTSSNYAITYSNGDYTIVPAGQLLVRATNVQATYGSAPVYAVTSVEYLDGASSLLALTPVAAAPGMFGYDDGLGGGIEFTLGASGATSGSGALVAGNYKIGSTGFTLTGANFSGTPVVVGALEVQRLALTAGAATAPNRVYDGTTDIGAVEVALSGVLAGDTVAGAGFGGYAERHAGTNLEYTIGGIALTGADAANYVLTGGGSVTAGDGIITPLAVTVQGATTVRRAYDGTTVVGLGGTPTIASFGVDTVAVDASAASGTLASANAGTGLAVTVSGYALSGADAANYSLLQPTGLTADVDRASLTVTGVTAAGKTYDGTTAASLSGGTFAGLVPADAGSVALTGSFVSPNAGTNVAVAASLTGAAASNYLFVAPALAADIERAPVTLAGAPGVVDRIYDGTTAASLTGDALTGVLPADAAGLSLVATFVTGDAGRGIGVTTTLGGTLAGNYRLVGSPTLSGEILAAPVTITGAVDVASKTYDGTTLATLSGGALAGLVPADAGGVSLVGAFVSPDAGSNVGVLAGLAGARAGNYVLVGAPRLGADITPAMLTLAGPLGVATKTYDGTTVATLSGGALAGLLPADAGGVSLLGSFVAANAGRGVAVTTRLGGALAGNYVLVGMPALTADIGAATLTATAAPATGVQGRPMPPLGGTLTGFVGGESLESLTALGYRAQWALLATGTAPGHYAVVGSFDAPNYVVQQAAANAGAFLMQAETITGTTPSARALATPMPGGTSPPTLAAATISPNSPFTAVPNSADATGAARSTGAGSASSATPAPTPGDAADVAASGGAPSSQGTTRLSIGGRRLIVIDGGVNTHIDAPASSASSN